MNIASILARPSAAHPDAVAVAVGSTDVWTYRTFATTVSLLAHALRNRCGLSAGARVALAMRNCPEFLLVLFAAQSHGTAKVAALFGPIMSVWFVAMALPGLSWIASDPGILWALNPFYGVDFLLHHGMIVVGLPYSAPDLADISELKGGSPYGAGTVAAPDGSRMPSQKELNLASFQGHHVAKITKRLAEG